MTKFSQKMMGKEVGQAETYAQPHGVAAKKANIVDPNTRAAKDVTPKDVAMRVSAGNPARDDVKSDGIKMRGAGAATKGVMSRGPMA